MPLAAVAVALALLQGGCAAGPSLTPSGKGWPVVTVTFPSSARPGSIHTATVRVDNPGPGDIGSLVVAFADVGAPSAEGLPTPIVSPGRHGSPGVVRVHPRPTATSPDGVIYRFGAVAEGSTTTVDFELAVPTTLGTAANSVTAYDAAEPDRARGARLETKVEE